MSAKSRAGDLLFGRYRVDSPLGRGSAGPSFLGTDLETEDRVVIKELPADRPDLFERFQGEIALLRHPGAEFADPEGIARYVIPVALGMAHDQPYAVRPYIEGVSLRDRLRQGPLPEDQVRMVIGDVARTLSAGHHENLVLRNLKPENILIDSGGRARISGIGTGCFLTRARREQLGVELGGLRYVAPEQLLDARRVDRASDLFALGLVLHEILAGASPVTGAAIEDLVEWFAAPRRIPLPPGPSDLAELAARLTLFHLAERPSRGEIALERAAPWMQPPLGEDECDGCKAVLPRLTAFCPACGRATRGPCPHCGRPLAIGASWCAACGERAEPQPRARLEGLVGGYGGEEVELPGDSEVRLGRAGECEVGFEGRDRYVSRHQCRIEVRRTCRWLLAGDWVSGRPTTNGTLHNGRNADGLGAQLLRAGDRLRIGDSFFRFREGRA